MNHFARNVAAYLLLATAFTTSSIAAPSSQPAPLLPAPVSADDRKLEAQLDRRLPEVRFDRVALDETIDFMRDLTGCNIYVDWRGIKAAGVAKNTPVAMNANNLPTREVFQDIFDRTGPNVLDGRVIRGVYVISTQADFADRKMRPGPYLAQFSDVGRDAAVLDRRLPEVKFDSVGLSDVIDFYRDLTHASIFVDWRAMAAAGVPKDALVTFSVRNIKFSTALDLMLDQAGGGKLGYVAEFTDAEVYDSKLKEFVKTKNKTELITISTISDLIATRSKPTTQPNDQ